MIYACSARGISSRVTLSSARGQLRQLFVRRGTSQKKKGAKKRREEAASKTSCMKRMRRTMARFLPAGTATCMKSTTPPNRPRTVATRTGQISDTVYATLTHRIIISLADSYLKNDKKSRGTPSPEDSGAVSRRTSQRQQEKAPEGRAPHSVVDGEADAEAPEADGAGPIE